ncbi:hypothetical protein HZH68_004362 [Vespula germanica]|uniref:Uncharacterized protein n=1 Tax=Vespula germanica TaxID=30212 RepID=A0A834KTQ5_VESGE|nr:hypothetical protein HZH68_004362 [Vespula germanica]
MYKHVDRGTRVFVQGESEQRVTARSTTTTTTTTTTTMTTTTIGPRAKDDDNDDDDDDNDDDLLLCGYVSRWTPCRKRSKVFPNEKIIHPSGEDESGVRRRTRKEEEEKEEEELEEKEKMVETD